MREDWGISLQYSVIGDMLLVAVKDVAEESPAKADLHPGDLIKEINDWNISKIKEPQIAANLFRAGGNFITLDIEREGKSSGSWKVLDFF